MFCRSELLSPSLPTGMAVLALCLVAGCATNLAHSSDDLGVDLAAGDLAQPNEDLGADHVVHVRSPHFFPESLTARVGETVRFVFDEPGHNVTTVTSAGDMDPVWAPDGRACSLPGDCLGGVRFGASPAGSHWDHTFPYPSLWPMVCGIHYGQPGQDGNEVVQITVTQ